MLHQEPLARVCLRTVLCEPGRAGLFWFADVFWQIEAVSRSCADPGTKVLKPSWLRSPNSRPIRAARHFKSSSPDPHLPPCPRPPQPLNGSAEWWPSGRRHTPAKGADGNVSRVRIPSTPPLAHLKPEMRRLTGHFFFLSQRGLAGPSDFRRLAFRPNSVSERPASLSIRPSPESRRIQKVYNFQNVVEIEPRRG